jgi:transposase
MIAFMPEVEAGRIYIREAAQMLNRRIGTIRKWEQDKVLPEHLRSERGRSNWRYWTPEQIEGIREWMRKTDRRSGKGLVHWNPTEKELEKAIEKMRRPHSIKRSRLEEI